MTLILGALVSRFDAGSLVYDTYRCAPSCKQDELQYRTGIGHEGTTICASRSLISVLQQDGNVDFEMAAVERRKAREDVENRS